MQRYDIWKHTRLNGYIVLDEGTLFDSYEGNGDSIYVLITTKDASSADAALAQYLFSKLLGE